MRIALLVFVLAAPAFVWGQTNGGEQATNEPRQPGADTADGNGEVIPTNSGTAGQALVGPGSVENQLESDRQEKLGLLGLNILEPWDAWKANLAEQTGLSFGLDYNVLGFVASDSLGDDGSAGGAIRLYGSWDLVGRNTKDKGGIIYKFENRHS